MAGGLGGRPGLRDAQSAAGRTGRRVALVPARDAAVPIRDAAHGARPQLHDGRRPHAPAPPDGLDGPAADGLRLVRPTGGERGHHRGRAPARDHRAQHRRDQEADEAAGVRDRLEARGLGARGRVLPLDAVAVPEVLRARPRLPGRGAGQLVSERSDGGRQRVRRRRALRPLRNARRGADDGAVVLQDHRVRRRAAGVRPARVGPVARADEDDPAQLDRPLGRRRDPVPDRGSRRRRAGVHDPAGHALRRDLLRARSGASTRRAHRERGGARVREAHGGAPW